MALPTQIGVTGTVYMGNLMAALQSCCREGEGAAVAAEAVGASALEPAVIG